MNHVFISYRHESPAHAAKVRAFAQKLRDQGLPVALDQFLQDDSPGGPDKGWRAWCEENAEKSMAVLIVCSAGWFASYRKEEQGKGLGAAWEADIFAQEIWDGKGLNVRVRLVILDDFDADQIPLRLKQWHVFKVADQLDLLSRWVRQRLSMSGVGTSRPKVVFLASCWTDMTRERKSLLDFLEDAGWEVRPGNKYGADTTAEVLESDMKDVTGYVQLLESYPSESGLHHLQDEVAVRLKLPRYLFRDSKVVLNGDDASHNEWLGRPEVTLGTFDDFRRYVRDELDKLWQRQQQPPASPSNGLKKALVRVVVRSPNREMLWDKVFNWIDREPGIRPHLLAEKETILEKENSPARCHGYLVVCDGAGYASGYTPHADLEQCAEIQMRQKDESRLPPAGLIYWPPPDVAWSKLQHIVPPRLLPMLGSDRPADLTTFFDEVRRVAS